MSKKALNNYGASLRTKSGYPASVSVKSLGEVLTSGGNSAFADRGREATTTLTISCYICVNEYIDFAGQKFTFVYDNPIKVGEVQIAITTNKTAQNLATAILKSKSEALKYYSIDVKGADVIVTQLSASASVIPINSTNAANVINTVTATSTTGALDLSGINDITDFINTPTATFSVVSRFLGLTSRAEALKYGNVAAQAATANSGDATAVYTVTIAGKVFNGSVFLPNGTANVNNLQANFVHTDTGEKFTATFGAANGNELRSGANVIAIAAHLTDLFNKSQFIQNQVLKVNTDVDDIFDSQGSLLVSLKGMTASLTTSSGIKNKKFKSFEIKDAGGGNVRITATISDPKGDAIYSTTSTPGAIYNLVKGSRLCLINQETGDELNFNLGEGGLVSLSNQKNHEIISWAMSSAFLPVADFKDTLNELLCHIAEYADYPDSTKKLLYIKTSKKLEATRAFLVKQGVKLQEIYNAKGELVAYGGYSLEAKVVFELMDHLIASDTKIDHVNKYGNTIVSIAAKCGNAELIKLLEKKVDKSLLNKPNNEAYTPLMYAAANDDSETFETLCKIGASSERSLEMALVECNRLVNLTEDAPPIVESPRLLAIVKNLVKWYEGSVSSFLTRPIDGLQPDYLADPKMAAIYNIFVICEIVPLISKGQKVENIPKDLFNNPESIDLFTSLLQSCLACNKQQEVSDNYSYVLPAETFKLITSFAVRLQSYFVNKGCQVTTTSSEDEGGLLSLAMLELVKLLPLSITKIKEVIINETIKQEYSVLIEMLMQDYDYTRKYEIIKGIINDSSIEITKRLMRHKHLSMIAGKALYDLLLSAIKNENDARAELFLENYQFFCQHAIIKKVIKYNRLKLIEALVKQKPFYELIKYYIFNNLLDCNTTLDMAKFLVETFDLHEAESHCSNTKTQVLAQLLIKFIRLGGYELIEPLIKAKADPFLKTEVKLDGKTEEFLSAWQAAVEAPSNKALSVLYEAVATLSGGILMIRLKETTLDANGFYPFLYVVKSKNYSKAQILSNHFNISLELLRISTFVLPEVISSKKYSQDLAKDFREIIKTLIIWGANPDAQYVTGVGSFYTPISATVKSMIESNHDKSWTSLIQGADPDALALLNQMELQGIHDSLFLGMNKKLPQAWYYMLVECDKDIKTLKLANKMLNNQDLEVSFSSMMSLQQQQLILERFKFYFVQNPKKLDTFNLSQYEHKLPPALSNQIKDVGNRIDPQAPDIELSGTDTVDGKEIVGDV